MSASAQPAKVFVSYVRDDAATVDRLAKDLQRRGLRVWMDRTDLAPGSRWKAVIRDAIRSGGGVIACFSQNYQSREKTYMNEELTLVIDELRARPTDQTWFVPVRLDVCDIPDRTIGGGETLRDIQQVDLFRDWAGGVRRIVAALK